MIVGIKDKKTAYLASSFNHYDYTGLMEEDLSLKENSPFLWHEAFPNGVIAVDKSPRLKWIIQSMDFSTFHLSNESLFHDFLMPLKEKLVELGLQKTSSYQQSIIFFMKEGQLAQIDAFGVIEVGLDYIMTDHQKGITINLLNNYSTNHPQQLIDKIMDAHFKYLHRQSKPFSLISTENINSILLKN